MFKLKCSIITVMVILMTFFAVYAEDDDLNDVTLSESIKTQFRMDNVSLSYDSFICDGKQHKPQVTVGVNGRTFMQNKDYTASYSDGINPGKQSVIVKGIGNCTGTVLLTYRGSVSMPMGMQIVQTKQTDSIKIKASWGKTYCDDYTVELYQNGTFLSKTTTKTNSFEKVLTKDGKYTVKVCSNLKNTKDGKTYSSNAVQKSTDVKIPRETITSMAIKCSWPVGTPKNKNSFKKGSPTKNTRRCSTRHIRKETVGRKRNQDSVLPAMCSSERL